MNYTIIAKQSNAVLIEWRDKMNILHRSIVPDSAMPELSETQAAAGIPFGVNWATCANDELANRLASALHERGIWTYADAANNIREFRAIVNEVAVSALLNAARGAK